jgi:N6-L-threonylcarbamoyladenine synthase
MKKTYILAIDTSCDDTSIAVTSGQQVLSNVIASQTELHKPYGGVFPTVAKLAHRENIDAAITVALKRAHMTMAKIDAIAVTVGPGLAPALEVGIAKAKELAVEYSKQVFPVNHVVGHISSVLAQPISLNVVNATTAVDEGEDSKTPNTKLPALALIISGGNSQFVLVKDLDTFQVLGSTLDDAAGECLDKIGRMLNLGYPAGPVIEQFAQLGNPTTYPFPLP